MNFDSFKNKWLGQVIDYDRAYRYQCVDLILQYVYECYGIPSGIHGNALDYWTKTGINGWNGALLLRFHKLQTNEVKQGDIVVLRTSGRSDLSGDGHIGVATGNLNASDAEILEQNGSTGSGDGQGKNRIRLRYVSRSRIAGVLRPNPAPSPAPAPAPAPAPPAAVVRPYRIEPITPKQMQLNKDVNKWGLNYDNFTAIKNNPEGRGSNGQVITVVAILHHNIGYNYYLEDASHASGWNVHDCNDYTPPAPAPAPAPTPVPEPTPQPAPTPPVSPSSVLPAGSIISKYQNEQYELLRELTGYTTANMAINHLATAKTVQVPAATYYVFNRYYAKGNQELLAINVSKRAGSPGAWIRVADNIIPTPEQIAAEEADKLAKAEAAKAAEAAQIEADRLAAEAKTKLPSFVAEYRDFPEAQRYVAMKALNVIDLEGLHNNVVMPQYSTTYIVGTFIVGGIEYGRPKSAADKNWWYGIELFDPSNGKQNLELESVVYDDNKSLEERRATKTMTIEDHLLVALAWLKSLPQRIRNYYGKPK